jgi:hypothetical protein
MKIDLNKEEIDFLLETLKYAKMSFENRVGNYPEPMRTGYYKLQYPEMKKKFENIIGKITMR